MLALQFGRVWPNPDASIASVNDRQHLAYLYRGIAVVAAAAATAKNRMTMGMGT